MMTNTGEPPHAADHGPAAAHAHAPAAAVPFTAEEWRYFRATDRTAGAYIVGLMAGIFSVGLVLYLIVLFSVM
jgi:hypothetical protein